MRDDLKQNSALRFEGCHHPWFELRGYRFESDWCWQDMDRRYSSIFIIDEPWGPWQASLPSLHAEIWCKMHTRHSQVLLPDWKLASEGEKGSRDHPPDVSFQQLLGSHSHSTLVAGPEELGRAATRTRAYFSFGGLCSTDEAFLLPTQQLQVRIPAPPRFFSLLLVCEQHWDQTHLVLSNGFHKCS